MPLFKEKSYTIEDIYNLPDGQRAELIDGKLYNMTPPGRIHQKLVSEFTQLLGQYVKSHNGSCEVYPAPFAVKLWEERRTIVEPDISVICDRSKLTERGCSGAPDWIIEIVSPGNSSHDYIRKLNLYADAKVREYWIVNPINCTVLVYRLEESKFEVALYTFQDKIKVNIYDDLWIDFAEIDA